MTYIFTLISVLIVSLLSFVGFALLLLKPNRLQSLIMFLVSLSAGTMLGDAAIHLLPEAVEKNSDGLNVWLWFLAGILFFFVLEKVVHWHHCHNPEECEHEKTLGVMNLVGDGMHNFIDGVIIAGSFLISLPLGLATTIAVIAHEIPQEIGDLGVLLHAGYTRGRALMFNFLSALIAFLGAGLTLIIGTRVENFSDYILPFTAGSFIYIATADLIPELKKHPALIKTLEQLIGILAGIGLMLVLKKLG
jgi:zinc and cadmium transporter